MKALRIFSFAAVGAFIFSGCASVAHVERDETVNLANYKSFAWIQTADTTSGKVKNKVVSLAENTIRKAVNSELATEGWKEVNGRADVLLSYDILVENATRESSNPVYSRSQTRYYFNPYTRRWNSLYYPSQFLGYDRDEYQTKEGTVTVTMVDAKTDKVIWQGWTTEEVNNRNLTSKELQNSIRTIFRKFDVAKN